MSGIIRTAVHLNHARDITVTGGNITQRLGTSSFARTSWVEQETWDRKSADIQLINEIVGWLCFQSYVSNVPWRIKPDYEGTPLLPKDMLKFVQLGLHCTRTILLPANPGTRRIPRPRPVQTCSFWNMYGWQQYGWPHIGTLSCYFYKNTAIKTDRL